MDADLKNRQLIAILSGGLPLVPHPYAVVAGQLGLTENEVVERIATLSEDKALSRLGVIVRHKELGYNANAMVVWDVPDDLVGALGRDLAKEPCVTLCYRRPRRPGWPYSLFTMIHGTSRDETLGKLEGLVERRGLGDIPRDILFSTRRFKQRGARYGERSFLKEAAAS
jgi:siroheme decarboxylase